MVEMTEAETDDEVDPMEEATSDVADRWDLWLSEAEEFLENIGFDGEGRDPIRKLGVEVYTVEEWLNAAYEYDRTSIDEVGEGLLVRRNNSTYWISEEARETYIEDLPVSIVRKLEKRKDLRPISSDVEGIERLPTGRAHKFLRALDRNLGAKSRDLGWDREVERAYSREADVPVFIAAQGKYYVAAWLAAHGHSNGRIASALGVSESTIKVNLSKFKNRED